MKKVKVIKKEERERQQIRPDVKRKLLLDEKSRLIHRARQIDRQLRVLEA